jgi:signal transduction histidine kinase
MRGRLRLWWVGWVAVVGTMVPLVTWAANSYGLYGRDNYGVCTYAGRCPSPAGSPAPVVPPASENPPPTLGETPGGLEFAINLTDGQIITPGTYTVSITPLNGQGSSFDHAVIYVDGQQVASVTPGSSGTAYWRWNNQATPGSEIRVVVYDKNGQSSIKTIKVRVASSSRQAKTTGFPVDLAFVLKRIATTIPLPVWLGFPWLLFVLLGLAMLIWVAAIRREIAALVALRKLYTSQTELMELKLGFVRLASHYLRTPITLIRAGVDAFDAASPVGASLKRLSDDLARAVERLLGPVEQQTFQAPQPVPVTVRSVAMTPGFVLPIVALILLVVIFNEFANLAGAGLLAAVNVAMQLAAIIVGGSFFYGLLRSRKLRIGERAQLLQLVEGQADLDRQRNDLMQASLTGLGPQAEGLRSQLQQAPAGPGRQSAEDGLTRLRQLLTRFDLVGKLTAVTEPPVPVASTLTAVLQVPPAAAAIQKAQAKPVQLSLPADVPVTVRDPWLAGYVLGTLIDNAAAYSRPGSNVAVQITSPAPLGMVVQDQGQGIASDKIARLFQPFSKAEGALDFSHEGAGLNLYLDRVIMTYLGGSIALESQLGQGTQATVKFEA